MSVVVIIISNSIFIIIFVKVLLKICISVHKFQWQNKF